MARRRVLESCMMIGLELVLEGLVVEDKVLIEVEVEAEAAVAVADDNSNLTDLKVYICSPPSPSPYS
jgi:hypothetical protein